MTVKAVAPAKEPKPHRLTAQDKDMLRSFARRLNQQFLERALEASQKRIEKAKADLEAAVQKLLKQTCTPKEAAVLRKFGYFTKCTYVSVGIAYGLVDNETGLMRVDYHNGTSPLLQVQLKQLTEMPRKLSSNDDDCIPLDRPAYDAFRAKYDAPKAIEKEVRDEAKTRLDAYLALIETAKTFEQVLDVWPEVEPLRNNICGLAPVVLIPDQLRETIANDMGERKAMIARRQSRPAIELMPPSSSAAAE